MMPPVTTKQRLRELASLRPEGHKVLSVYLNLDPSEFPTQRDRKIEVESLLDVAERALRDDGLPHQQKDELKNDVERIRAWFDREFDASGARGVAVFASSGADLFEIHRLSRPVRSEVTIDDSPFIEPLAGMPGDDGYGVALINRKVTRILAGGAGQMREVMSFADDVHPWHDQGGWSQSRFQRGIEKEVKDHLKHANDELFKLFKRGVVQRLIIGCPDEMRGEVEHTLHSYLRERIAGWLDIDVRARPARSQARRPRSSSATSATASATGSTGSRRGWRVTSAPSAGLADTLEALNEQRVEALLVADGFRTEGYASPQADFLAAEPGTSPTGEELQHRDDVVESAIERALEQSAEVVFVRHHPDMQAVGSIGAVLRY